MKPHEQCKAAGLKSLAALSEITEVSIQTLNNWSKNKQKLFNVVVTGASKEKCSTSCAQEQAKKEVE